MAKATPFDDSYGVILYNLEMDGCLNGVYTNQGASSEIYSEILKKKPKAAKVDDILFSDYDCQFMDNDGPHYCEVKMKKHKYGYYILEWFEHGDLNCRGIGYRMNDRQIVVYYGE